jgi:hypothetical protein
MSLKNGHFNNGDEISARVLVGVLNVTLVTQQRNIKFQSLSIKIQSCCDVTNFKGPSKKFVISKVRYIEIHDIKSINQQNLLSNKSRKFRFY